MSITEFLLERIGEDEAAALAAVDGQADPENGWGYEGRALIPHVGIIHHAVQAEHITRWHPYRVVAECAAKRAIVEKRLTIGLPDRPISDGQAWLSGAHEAVDAERGHILRTLAAVYADHPDYQTEWKP